MLDHRLKEAEKLWLRWYRALSFGQIPLKAPVAHLRKTVLPW